MASAYARAFMNPHNALRNSINVLSDVKPEDVAKAAKLDWHINETPALFKSNDGSVHEFKGRKTLYRDDDTMPLSIVGNGFKTVQPSDILGLYFDLAKRFGFQIEFGGAVQHGRRIWAMARTPYELEVIKGDKVAGYLLFGTACDGTSATYALFNGIRLYCTNQIPRLLSRAGKRGPGVIRITHAEKFTHEKVMKGLELIKEDWDTFGMGVQKLAKKKVTNKQAVEFFTKLMYPTGGVPEDALTSKVNRVYRLIETYETGQGQEGIKGTAWGVLNAVTRFIDHESRAKNSDTRLYRAWFGGGARMKAEAYQQLITLAK